MSVGKIYISTMEYIDKKENKIKLKARPILIIAEPIGLDMEYTVLPVSSVSNRKFYNHEYDVELKTINFPKISLKKDCFVRTHKQTTIYKCRIDFNNCVGDLKKDYPRTYYEILEKLNKYENKIICNR